MARDDPEAEGWFTKCGDVAHGKEAVTPTGRRHRTLDSGAEMRPGGDAATGLTVPDIV